jgi:hypothetical protein
MSPNPPFPVGEPVPPGASEPAAITREPVEAREALVDTPEAPVSSPPSRSSTLDYSHPTTESSNTEPMPVSDPAASSPKGRPRSGTARRTSTASIDRASRTTVPTQVVYADTENRTTSPERERMIEYESNIAGYLEEDYRDYTSNDYQTFPNPSPSQISGLTSLTTRTTGSGSSSGSGSTITQGSYRRRRSVGKSHEEGEVARERRDSYRASGAQERPDVLSFLEADSPALTQEVIQRTVEEASHWRMSDRRSRHSPSTQSSGSSASGSSFHSDTFSEPLGDHQTDRSSSPEHSVNGDSPHSATSAKLQAQLAASERRQRAHRNYGTPEMPRGNANHPHIPPNALQPRIPSTYQGHVKYLPRAEKLPLSGYELLASRLSVGNASTRQIKPIYRRFEALNHRLLLYLQDELAELEEQLHRLDTADTQTRRLPTSILPASRRNDAMAGGELQWHRMDILSKIGWKLSQYSKFKLLRNSRVALQ